MARLKGKRVCISSNGRGSIGGALREALLKSGASLVEDSENPPAVDFAICTVGKMLVRDAGLVSQEELDGLYSSNYRYPRLFTERHIKAMKAAGKNGLILHIGSNAARYGNAGAEDYAAFKVALVKYMELRARTVREFGVRLSVLNLGAVDTEFWEKVAATADRDLARQILPKPEKALSLKETAELVLAVLQMPERVAVKDALIVSVDYQ